MIQCVVAMYLHIKLLNKEKLTFVGIGVSSIDNDSHIHSTI